MTGMFNTEDIYFCVKCKDYIENIEIFVDTNIIVPHLLDPFWVDETNVEIIKEFYEKLGLSSTDDVEDIFGGQHEYIDSKLEEVGEDFTK